MRVLVLGGTGMLGHALFRQLSSNSGLEVFSTVRSLRGFSQYFLPDQLKKILEGVDANDIDAVVRAFATVQPDVVINCIGLIKQSPLANDPLLAININSLFPHRLSQLCRTASARMIHISTDCVFDGQKGNYTEEDPSDAKDLYGKSKFLGEVTSSHCLTLRTSIIGHELKTKYGLIEWFLTQERIKGYSKAIFSGFPTNEIARIIEKYVLHDSKLRGLYHLSANPISKLDLLRLVAQAYGKDTVIEEDDQVNIDRSLNSDSFRKATGYMPPTWLELVKSMHADYFASAKSE